MSSLPAHAYAEWRQETIVAPALREAAVSPPPERFLQQVWQHQRLLRDRLRTAEGRSVRVLHPGFWNVEAGPDFRGAVIQFGQEPPVSGDIEIDLVPGGWQAHRHAGNPAYHNVVLHVVWEAGGRNSIPLPTLALKEALDAPIEELAEWIGKTSGAPRELAGQCCGPLGQLDRDTRLALLHQAAQVRLQRKAALFIARARQTGWEQALWEGLFTALGYKHNVWPMRSLAELLPRLVTGPAGRMPALIELQGRLFGTGGLLPHELEEKTRATNDYFRGVWDAWWRERDRFAEVAIPARVWRLHGLRPANHPQRRLALAGHWLARGNLPDRLEEWFKEAVAGKEQAPKLLAVLSAPEEDFWSTHYTFRSRASVKPQPLLGEQRCTDLAVNVVLPWFWARAATGGNQEARARVERGYFAWPAGEDNAVLRLARQRLLGEVHQKLPATAAVQQGLIQIVRDFCDHADATCAGCRFPGLVNGISR